MAPPRFIGGKKPGSGRKKQRSGILLFAKSNKFCENAQIFSGNNALYLCGERGALAVRGSFSLQALWLTCSWLCGRALARSLPLCVPLSAVKLPVNASMRKLPWRVQQRFVHARRAHLPPDLHTQPSAPTGRGIFHYFHAEELVFTSSSAWGVSAIQLCFTRDLIILRIIFPVNHYFIYLY